MSFENIVWKTAAICLDLNVLPFMSKWKSPEGYCIVGYPCETYRKLKSRVNSFLRDSHIYIATLCTKIKKWFENFSLR